MKVSRTRLALGCLFTPLLSACTLLYLLYLSMYSLGGDPHSVVVGPSGRVYVVDSGMRFSLFPLAGGCIWVIDTQYDRINGLVKVREGVSDITVAANERIYVGYISGGYEGAVGLRSPALQPSMPSCNATGMLALPNGHVLVPGVKNMLVIDSATDQIVKRIAMPDHHQYGMVAVSDQEAYVLFIDRILRLSLDSYEILGYIEIPDYWAAQKIVASKQDELAYLAIGGFRDKEKRATRKILVLDTRLHQVVDEIVVSKDHDTLVGMCLTPDGKLYLLRVIFYHPVWDAGVDDYHVTVVSPQSRQVLGEIELPDERTSVSGDYYRYRIAVAPNGKVYVVHGASAYNSSFEDSPETYVIVIDPQRDEIVGTIPLRRPLWANLWPFDGIWAFIVLACFSPGLIAFFVLLVSLLKSLLSTAVDSRNKECGPVA